MNTAPMTAPRRSRSAASGTAVSVSAGVGSAAAAVQDIAADARNATTGFREWARTEFFYVWRCAHDKAFAGGKHPQAVTFPRKRLDATHQEIQVIAVLLTSPVGTGPGSPGRCRLHQREALL